VRQPYGVRVSTLRRWPLLWYVTAMGSHNPPRYCFTDIWWVSATETVTVRFTTGEYYAYSGVTLGAFLDFAALGYDVGKCGQYFNTYWPLFPASVDYVKVSTGPTFYDEYIPGFNPAFPPNNG
jgi:hypothetical protein